LAVRGEKGGNINAFNTRIKTLVVHKRKKRPKRDWGKEQRGGRIRGFRILEKKKEMSATMHIQPTALRSKNRSVSEGGEPAK